MGFPTDFRDSVEISIPLGSQLQRFSNASSEPALADPVLVINPRIQPRYHVILLNDDDHTYRYVIEMMLIVFGHPPEKGFLIAKEVDKAGRAICLTTSF